MKRIILHIGHQKTGSTALQDFLADHYDQISGKGICYYKPLHRFVPWSGNSNAHFILAYVLNKLKEPTDEKKKAFFDSNDSLNILYVSLKDEDYAHLDAEKENFIKAINEYDTIILSEEMFFHYDHFYEDYWKIIKEYIQECAGKEVRIDVVAYIRRQDEWVLSKWKQDLINFIAYTWDFDETLKEYEEFGYLDYYRTLKRISDVFGKEHLYIRDSDRSKMIGKNIIDDFVGVLNLPIDISDKDEYSKINASPPLFASYGISQINKTVKLNSKLKVYEYDIAKLLSFYFNNKTHALTKQERIDLLNRLMESNENISKEFFDGKGFFDYDVKDVKVIKTNKRKNFFYKKLMLLLIKMHNGLYFLHDKYNYVKDKLKALKK